MRQSLNYIPMHVLESFPHVLPMHIRYICTYTICAPSHSSVVELLYVMADRLATLFLSLLFCVNLELFVSIYVQAVTGK